MKRASRAALAGVLLASCVGGPSGIDRTISVAGGELDVWCDGGEGPTILFVSAIGGDDTLRSITDRFTSDANACFYFRPGDGETEAPVDPRTSTEDGEDLLELLQAAGLATPVIVVAHSYGGFVALHAAAEQPGAIAGIVLVDASTPAADERFYPSMTDAQRTYYDHRLDDFPYVDWATSVGQAAADLDAYPAIPTTVITATRAFLDPCDPELPCEALQNIWIEVQQELADAIGARQVLADTGHYVHVDDPDLVEREIRAILERSGVLEDPTPEPG